MSKKSKMELLAEMQKKFNSLSKLQSNLKKISGISNLAIMKKYLKNDEVYLNLYEALVAFESNLDNEDYPLVEKWQRIIELREILEENYYQIDQDDLYLMMINKMSILEEKKKYMIKK